MSKSNLMKYKDFHGSVEVSIDDSVLHGKIECINDLITYEANTPSELNKAFEDAVDDYLETCKELNKLPNKPMSGTFNVRVGKELHKQAYIHAKNYNMSLNELIKSALEDKLSTSENKEMHLHLHLDQDRKKSEYTFDTDFSKPLTNESTFLFATQKEEKVH